MNDIFAPPSVFAGPAPPRWTSNAMADHAAEFVKLDDTYEVGDPRPTNAFTVEQLVANGIVGIYERHER